MNCKIYVTSVVGGETVSPTDIKLSPAGRNTDIQPLHKGYRLWIKTNILWKIISNVHYPVDEDSNLVKIGIKRKNVLATLYFSFEKEERESSFGFVWNDTEKLNFYTMSGNLELNDLNKVLRDMVEFIFMASTEKSTNLKFWHTIYEKVGANRKQHKNPRRFALQK